MLRRPAVTVSNNGADTTAERFGRGVVTVVPVTSNVERIYPFQVLLPAAETGLAMASGGAWKTRCAPTCAENVAQRPLAEKCW